MDKTRIRTTAGTARRPMSLCCFFLCPGCLDLCADTAVSRVPQELQKFVLSL
ncbi:MAG: hypothetical protein Q4G15_12880 [Lachnospiraceae bacterium]|nr:hypothetical protein [Lachnospiraceae bacterium]